MKLLFALVFCVVAVSCSEYVHDLSFRQEVQTLKPVAKNIPEPAPFDAVSEVIPDIEPQIFPRFKNLEHEPVPALPGYRKSKFLFGRKKQVYEVSTRDRKKKASKARIILKVFRYANAKDIAIFILGLLSAIAAGFMSPFAIYRSLSPIMGAFIQQETPGNSQHLNATEQASLILSFVQECFILGAISFILGFIQIISSEIAARNIMAKIKTAYLAKMLSMEMGWYDRAHEQFVSILAHDLEKMMVLFDSKMTSAAEVISYFFFGTIFGLLVSWKVALVTLGLMCLCIIGIYFIILESKKKGKLKQEFSGKCTKVASEVLGNARTVAAFGGEYKEIERYRNMLKMSSKYELKHTMVISMAKGFNFFQLCICNVIAYYYSVYLFRQNDFDPASIYVILVSQINCLNQCAYILSTVSDLFMATDSAYKVMEFLMTETSYNKSLEQGIKPTLFDGGIAFRGVQFSYPTALHTKVLHDLTLDIEPGKVTAVVGTSGAGKSTIVGLISRLYDVSVGQVLIGGVDIRKLHIGWLRNQIGVVGQEPALFDLSIKENIQLGKTNATLEEIIEAAKISHAHSFIQMLSSGYDSIVGENGTKLSGGQKQRIAIARAIVRKPKLLLLDEATSALDSRSEGIVQEALDNAMRDRTTLIIAHRMSTVRKADMIYAIKEGRIVEKGTHLELMELKGYYYSLVKIQELKEKGKSLNLSEESWHKEEIMEEKSPSHGEDSMEVTGEGKKQRLNKKNIKLLGIWFVAFLFILLASTFKPGSHYMGVLVFQSYTQLNDEINEIALVIAGAYCAICVIVFISEIVSGVMLALANRIWLKKLQMKAFNKSVCMDISWFDRTGNSPNECLETLTSCPSLIESFAGGRSIDVLTFVLTMVSSMIVCFFVSIRLALVNIPFIVIFIIINTLRLRYQHADSRSQSLATRSTKVAAEYVQSVKTIQSLNCQEYVICQYNEILTLSKKAAYTSIWWYALVFAVTKVVIRFMLAITFMFGADEVADGSIKGTTLMGVIVAISAATRLASPAIISLSQYPAARQAMDRLCRIADTKPSLNPLTDEGTEPEIRGNIVFKDVMFSYPTRNEVQVFKKLNLEIEIGKTVALVGDSGCGKSTIISLLERFYFPTGGKIMIDGNNIDNINVRYLRRQMGLVSQEPVLFDMTIKENILYGLEEEVMMEKVIEAAKVANIHDFIIKLPQAYDTPVGERGSKLSGGQKQRIAIARAVLRNPKILLLDEATSALDTESEKAVQEALEKASVGKTTIVIAHRLSTIRGADKIIVLQSGMVVEEGTHDELMQKRGYYFNLSNR